MSMMEIGALGGMILCGGYLLKCTLSGIKERIEKKRKEKKEQAYTAAWATWGDITALPKV